MRQEPYNLKVDRNRVIEDAGLLTAYQGGKTEVENYNEHRIKKSDKQLIDIWFDEARSELNQLLLHYLYPIQDKPFNDEITFTIVINNYPEHQYPLLENKAKDIVVDYIKYQWYSMIQGKDEQNGKYNPADIAQVKYSGDVATFRHLLNTRKRPIRTKLHPF